ncbi:MAG: CHAP domain-containing protein [Armatimonadetes bacterium]|nr:CHAP domain-containing protein [Armatimonadota bacterium]
MDYGRLCENTDLWGYDPGFDVRRFLSFIDSPRPGDVPDFPAWVQTAALRYDINPRMLLAIAQKEQSFLTRPGHGRGWQRALDWTMGYGATDSGDIPRYKGTRNQVFSAARGLRGYWDRGLVQRMVGKPLGRTMAWLRDEATARIVPQNEATAALYLYTPHRHGAVGFAQCWSWLKEKEAAFRGDSRPQQTSGAEQSPSAQPDRPSSPGDSARARVVAIAKRVARAREDGLRQLWINGISFEPREAGYCAEFVREVHEAALGLPAYTWPYRGASAREVERKLRAAGKQIPASARRPGDVVAFNRAWPGRWGHVAIYLGKDARGQDLVAEDTRSGIRINPIGSRAWHISGWYSVLPAEGAGYSPGPVRVVLLPGSEIVECDAVLEGDAVRCDLRPLAEALGAEVYDHIPDQRKVYLRVKPAALADAEDMTGGED